LKPDLAMPAHTTGMIPATNTAPYEINMLHSSLSHSCLKGPAKNRKKSH
jgi:hypothetical protein